MIIRSIHSALLIAIVLGSTAATANAQTPPPKKESELVAAGHKRLSGQEISALLVGNTIYGIILAPTGGGKAGDQFIIFYRTAKARVTVLSQGRSAGKKFESNWWVDGNLLCHEQRVGNLGHHCYALYDVSSSLYLCVQPAGDCNFLGRVVPGNPDNI